MNLKPLLNNLITSGLDLTDPDIIKKHKVLNIFQMALIIIAPLAGLFFRLSTGDSLLFYASIFTAALMAAGILLLRKIGNLVICGNYAIFILWAFICIISWKTGAISIVWHHQPLLDLNAGLNTFSHIPQRISFRHSMGCPDYLSRQV
jgi:hypothetical protein